MKRFGKQWIWLLAATLAGCDTYVAEPIDGALVQLAFEGNLENLGSAALLGAAHDETPWMKPGPTGKYYVAQGRGGWLQFTAPETIEISGSVEISFDARNLDWKGPPARKNPFETMLNLSGQMPGRMRHITFNTGATSKRVEVSYRDENDETIRLSSEDGALSDKWRKVALTIDADAGETRLTIDGRAVASSPILPYLATHGVDAIRVGTWHKSNQAFRGEIDNVVVRRLDSAL